MPMTSILTKLVGVVALFPIVLSACAQQELTQDHCVVTRGSSFTGTTGVQEHIKVAVNDKWYCMRDGVRGQCASFRRSIWSGRKIETPPVHGTASIRDTPYATEIFYTPAPNFVGDDQFVVAFGPDYTTVFVQVVPVTGKATVR